MSELTMTPALSAPWERAALLQLSAHLGQQLAAKGLRVATAESCTGGGVAAAITASAGSSAWFEYGVVTYANAAKHKLLGVALETLVQQGAVSKAVVVEMVQGVLALAGADVAVAISGIAGPGGGTPEKPVGTVWFAWLRNNGNLVTERHQFRGDREAIQQQAVACALQGLIGLAAI